MNALLIDDERLARAELRRLLEPHPQIRIVGEAVNGEDGLEKIHALNPDLLFLDIQMPGKNGFELLNELTGRTPRIIFTTAYDEYALRAFEFNALDYLLKPIEADRLDAALRRLQEKDEDPALPERRVEPGTRPLGEQDQVFVKDGEKCWFVTLSKVRFFESVGNYVRLHFDNQRPLILRSLNALDERLDPNVFFRANRKHIINLRMIENIEPYFSGGLVVRLQGGERIEISRRQAIRFKELLSL